MAEFIHIVKAVFGIVVVVGSIPDGRTTYSDAPSIILAGDEQRVVQVARVGHGVLFIFHAFVEHGGHLRYARSGQAAVVHIDELVAIHT